MAVVQISKIQVRRGLKNSGIGVPQLSSAEFAWAVDTQELYIGNGSVLEGAPFVGNTKIITERDNILELAAGYQFANNDPAISFSVSRTLQSKVDEYVSVLDFGAVGDGITDNVEAFQTAFTQLFRNADSKFKKILFVPNGVYKFSSNLRIPGTANIQGESNYETILRFDNSNILLITEDGTDVCARGVMEPMPATGEETPVDGGDCAVSVDADGNELKACYDAVPYEVPGEEGEGVIVDEGTVDETLMFQSGVTKSGATPNDQTASSALAAFGVLVGALGALGIGISRQRAAKK